MNRYEKKNGVSPISMVFLVLLMGTLALGSTASPGESTELDISSSVLIFFNNTTHEWSDVKLPMNSSAFNATQKACADLNYDLNSSVSELGVFVNGINGVTNAADWSESWTLLLWNSSGEKWDSSGVGCGQYEMNDGASIAWQYGAWGCESPSVTPLNRVPASEDDTDDNTGDNPGDGQNGGNLDDDNLDDGSDDGSDSPGITPLIIFSSFVLVVMYFRRARG